MLLMFVLLCKQTAGMGELGVALLEILGVLDIQGLLMDVATGSPVHFFTETEFFDDTVNNMTVSQLFADCLGTWMANKKVAKEKALAANCAYPKILEIMQLCESHKDRQAWLDHIEQNYESCGVDNCRFKYAKNGGRTAHMGSKHHKRAEYMKDYISRFYVCSNYQTHYQHFRPYKRVVAKNKRDFKNIYEKEIHRGCERCGGYLREVFDITELTGWHNPDWIKKQKRRYSPHPLRLKKFVPLKGGNEPRAVRRATPAPSAPDRAPTDGRLESLQGKPKPRVTPINHTPPPTGRRGAPGRSAIPRVSVNPQLRSERRLNRRRLESRPIHRLLRQIRRA